MNIQMMVFAIDEDVGRAVVRRSGRSHLKTERHAYDEITLSRFQSVSDEATALRPPSVLHVHVHLARHERGNLILETFTPIIRERKIVRVGTDAQMFSGLCSSQRSRLRLLCLLLPNFPRP